MDKNVARIALLTREFSMNSFAANGTRVFFRMCMTGKQTDVQMHVYDLRYDWILRFVVISKQILAKDMMYI